MKDFVRYHAMYTVSLMVAIASGALIKPIEPSWVPLTEATVLLIMIFLSMVTEETMRFADSERG